MLSSKMFSSIIIPVYDEQKEIGSCLNSLTQQTYMNFEVIVIDDGSTDNTLDIVKGYDDILDIKILTQNHQGPGNARNLGAKEAKGEVLFFVDADMTFSQNYLENLLKPIIEDKSIIGTTHNYEIATNTDNIWSKLWGPIRVSKEQAADSKVFRAIRKDKFLELGGFDSKYGYADDQTIFLKHNIRPFPVEATCYHKNPDTLKGTFKQARWIGASWRERFRILRILLIGQLAIILALILLPFAILFKAVKSKMKNDISFNNNLLYAGFKFTGYYLGALRAVFLHKFYK